MRFFFNVFSLGRLAFRLFALFIDCGFGDGLFRQQHGIVRQKTEADRFAGV
jgi:hypothetical protein